MGEDARPGKRLKLRNRGSQQEGGGWGFADRAVAVWGGSRVRPAIPAGLVPGRVMAIHPIHDAHAIRWEIVPCPLCGDADGRGVFRTRDPRSGLLYRLAECSACGMIYLNPRPDEASISQFYPDDYCCYQPREKS